MRAGKVLLNQGFTLLQLLIALVALSVLVAIALPACRSHLLHGRRSEATAALQRIQSAEERFFIEHNRYAADLTARAPMGLGLPAESPSGSYSLALDVNDRTLPTAFTVSAKARHSPSAAQDETCQVFSLNQNGLRRARDTHGADRTSECWR